ncbi:hypothetical protein BDB00DRAFT_877645 [Zychaea mexicana]|uniref:uncharacterized protein n=1 Tax=Zychaea mexicana TaxID=64656 RepID=UPI0022FEA225|nr:uncharacterized protein BDB00DRAFT_877645 [Zychaea mexicana]KAI9488260.1 hypothetical protein BDB00DRAFT_877645 [Zychaea mexicana]
MGSSGSKPKAKAPPTLPPPPPPPQYTFCMPMPCLMFIPIYAQAQPVAPTAPLGPPLNPPKIAPPDRRTFWNPRN